MIQKILDLKEFIVNLFYKSQYDCCDVDCWCFHEPDDCDSCDGKCLCEYKCEYCEDENNCECL